MKACELDWRRTKKRGLCLAPGAALDAIVGAHSPPLSSLPPVTFSRMLPTSNPESFFSSSFLSPPPRTALKIPAAGTVTTETPVTHLNPEVTNGLKLWLFHQFQTGLTKILIGWTHPVNIPAVAEGPGCSRSYFNENTRNRKLQLKTGFLLAYSVRSFLTCCICSFVSNLVFKDISDGAFTKKAGDFVHVCFSKCSETVVDASVWIFYVMQPRPLEESGVTAGPTCRTGQQRNATHPKSQP